MQFFKSYFGSILIFCCFASFYLGSYCGSAKSEKELTDIDKTLVDLDQHVSQGIEVRADVDLIGIGQRRLAMYENKGNNWVIGSKDTSSSDIRPIMLFNYDWAYPENQPLETPIVDTGFKPIPSIK